MLAKVDALPRSQREAAIRDGDVERGPDDRALSSGGTSQPQQPGIERGAEAGAGGVGGAGAGGTPTETVALDIQTFVP